MTIHSHNKGFTLIELMVTVGVLAIIAAVAIPAYRGYIETAKRTECFNELAAINLAQEEHFLEYNTYFSGERKSGDTTLKDNSHGYYKGVYTTEDNCTYKVVAGPTSDMKSYVLTAEGANDLSGTIKTFTKQ